MSFNFQDIGNNIWRLWQKRVIYLLLTTGYTLVLFVMAMEVATSVYVLKSDSLVLFPCLPAPFDYKPMNRS